MVLTNKERKEFMNKNTKSTDSKITFKDIIRLIIEFALVFLIARFASSYVQQHWISRQPISGDSMAPTITNQQTLILRRTERYPKRGQIIVFKAKGTNPAEKGKAEYIKRVIATEGDTVKKKGENLYVNGKLVNQDFLQYKSAKFVNSQTKQDVTADGKFERSTGSGVVKVKNDNTRINETNWTLKDLSSSENWNHWSQNTSRVPKNCYFVLGDHRSISNDSRYFGYVQRKDIVGVIFAGAWVSKSEQALVNDQYQHFFM